MKPNRYFVALATVLALACAAPDVAAQEPLMVFFPPTTPVFGAPISVATIVGSSRDPRAVPPEGLADFVGEFFYPPLGTRLAQKPLNEKLSKQLDAYRAHRNALLGELQNQLALAEPLGASERAEQLREFARGQTPRIVALEIEAEQLRADLVTGDSLFAQPIDWNAYRAWRIGDERLGSGNTAAFAEAQVLRAAIYYQTGLTPAQRGFLRELALAQQESLRAGRSPATVRATTLIFFSPESSRFPLPVNLTPAVGAKIERYNHDKEELKKELRDVIVELDRVSDGKRTKLLEALAEKQWPRLRELEELAEEVRLAVATLPEPPRPRLPALLPVALSTGIDTLQRDLATFQRERRESANRAASSPVQLALKPGSSRDEINQRVSEYSKAIAERRKQAEEAFMEANAERYAALAARARAITRELTEFAAAHPDPATGQPFDVGVLLRTIQVANAQFEQWSVEEVIYKDYKTAAWQPGLSPEQRRLLFAAAIAGLAQPLPAGRLTPRLNPAQSF